MTHSQRQHEPNHDKGQHKGRIMESLDLGIEQCVNHQRRRVRGLFMVWDKKKSLECIEVKTGTQKDGVGGHWRIKVKYPQLRPTAWKGRYRLVFLKRLGNTLEKVRRVSAKL